MKLDGPQSVFFTAMFVLVSWTIGCSPQRVAAPTSYEKYRDKEGAFSIEYPAGWTAEGGGKHGVKWAEFSSGNALIKINFDVSSSVINDIASIGGASRQDPNDQVPVELAPIHASHLFNKDKTASQFSGYTEEDPIPYQCNMGDSRKSIFKASSFSGRIRGYRATSVTVNNGVLITCTCASRDWKNLQPAFDHVLESLSY